MTDNENTKIRFEVYEFAFYALNSENNEGKIVKPTFDQTKELADLIANWVGV